MTMMMTMARRDSVLLTEVFRKDSRQPVIARSMDVCKTGAERPQIRWGNETLGGICGQHMAGHARPRQTDARSATYSRDKRECAHQKKRLEKEPIAGWICV